MDSSKNRKNKEIIVQTARAHQIIGLEKEILSGETNIDEHIPISAQIGDYYKEINL
jgi:hypothetical protein